MVAEDQLRSKAEKRRKMSRPLHPYRRYSVTAAMTATGISSGRRPGRASTHDRQKRNAGKGDQAEPRKIFGASSVNQTMPTG